MSPIIFPFPGQEELARRIIAHAGGTPGTLILHRFPDREMYVRLDTPVTGREAVFICTLDHPDAKLLSLLFAVAAAKDLGATRVGIIAPYLAYLRQDTRFIAGEAVTSATVGRLISGLADWITTVDPHLHRYHSLNAVYSIPSVVVHAAPLISKWIVEHTAKPLLIGPDSESEQWVAEVATGASAPYVVLEKTRRGDRDVELSIPHVQRHRDRTPILVDDIVATARTMVAAVAHLRDAGLCAPVCIAVHALFAEGAYEELVSAGAGRVVTCNTVRHPSNGIDVDQAIADQVRALLANVIGEAQGEAKA